jgi:hypothetical protein
MDTQQKCGWNSFNPCRLTQQIQSLIPKVVEDELILKNYKTGEMFYLIYCVFRER